MDNRPGAGSTIGAEIAARAPADGYTLLMISNTHVIGAAMYRTLKYDATADFTPVLQFGDAPNVLVVHPSLPARSVRELISLAKSKPGELMYASAGSGAATHLSSELFNRLAGVKIMRVAYKGSGLAANALAGGEVQVMFGSVALGFGFVKSGRIRILGVASSKPSALAPDVPTIAASGLPGFEAGAMAGMFAPARTPPSIVQRLNGEILRALERSDVKERLLAAGIDVYTTLNVQHVESLNDVVAAITGVVVCETVPDSIFDRAHEVELVDLQGERFPYGARSRGQPRGGLQALTVSQVLEREHGVRSRTQDSLGKGAELVVPLHVHRIPVEGHEDALVAIHG